MISAETFEWKKHVDETLAMTDYCALATVDVASGVWSNPVYFAWDANYNLYFISQMSSRHMQNIKKDGRVAISIYKTEQKGDVVGIQLIGEAKIITKEDNKEEIRKAYETYHGRSGHGPDTQKYMDDPAWLYVKIILSQMYYFDTRFFDEIRQTVPMGALRAKK